MKKMTLLAIILALAISSMLNDKSLRLKGFFRTAIFLPCISSLVAYSIIFKSLFASDGFVNAIMLNLNLIDAPISWISHPTLAKVLIIIAITWRWTGYNMVFFLSGMQGIEYSIYEAARIDGATGSQTLFQVIIPNVMPSIATCTFLTLTNSFKMFDQNMALTGGLPSIIVDKAKVNVTELLALNIYSTYNINKNWHGVAQAKAVIFFILVAVLAIAQQWATRSKEVEQ